MVDMDSFRRDRQVQRVNRPSVEIQTIEELFEQAKNAWEELSPEAYIPLIDILVDRLETEISEDILEEALQWFWKLIKESDQELPREIYSYFLRLSQKNENICINVMSSHELSPSNKPEETTEPDIQISTEKLKEKLRRHCTNWQRKFDIPSINDSERSEEIEMLYQTIIEKLFKDYATVAVEKVLTHDASNRHMVDLRVGKGKFLDLSSLISDVKIEASALVLALLLYPGQREAFSIMFIAKLLNVITDHLKNMEDNERKVFEAVYALRNSHLVLSNYDAKQSKNHGVAYSTDNPKDTDVANATGIDLVEVKHILADLEEKDIVKCHEGRWNICFW